MSSETQKLELAEQVVIATLLAGVLPENEATEVAQQVKAAGGLALFNNEIYLELWRRIHAAVADSKAPWAYAMLPQVEKIDPRITLGTMDKHTSRRHVETVYLPELIAAARRRRINRAAQSVIDGGDTAALADALREPTPQKSQTKSEVANAIIDRWEKAAQKPGQISGIDTGLLDLNRITWGWQPENLIIIGARPSKGKTALLIGFARAAAIEANVPTLFVTLESSISELTARLACQMSRSNQMDLRGGQASERDIAGLPRAFAKINTAPIHFLDCSGQHIGAIQAAVKSFTQNMGIKLVLVDYLQKIKPTHVNEKKTYEVGQASEGLKDLAKECGVPVVSAAQLNRESDKKKGQMATLADLSDSSQIEKDADVVGLIHVDGDDYSLLIAKNRDGPLGLVQLHFTPSCARFDNAAKIEDRDLPGNRSRSASNDS